MRNFIINELRNCLIILVLIIIGIGYYTENLTINNKELDQRISSIKRKSSYVKFYNIDRKFLKSMVAIEDHRFYSHGAIDVISVTRATLNNLKAGRVVQGGSTITQQLAKNICLSNERSFKRKFKELLLAIELERKYSKEEILELYVNVIYFGDGHTGIGEAAKGYFGKKASDLTFDEATLLAGLPQAPNLYALSKNNGLAKIRQRQVINAFEKYSGRNLNRDLVKGYLIN